MNDKEEKLENTEDKAFAIAAINGLLKYLKETQKTSLDHINKIKIYTVTKYMLLDLTARRNLEITEKLRDKSRKGTLLWVLDKTSTSMGARQLKRWLNNPLIDVEDINKRLNAVKELKESFITRGEIQESLKKVYDIERLVGKVAYGNANGRDLIALKNSLGQLPNIKHIISTLSSPMLKQLYQNLDEMSDIYQLIEKSIVEEPPLTIKEGGLIKLGYHSTVDEYKKATTEGKNWIIQLEAEEKEKTGIRNLKVGFNKVFGYYIEVTKSYLNQVPDRFIRKQTLANCERYITEELKQIEEKVLGAEEKIISLEYELFLDIRAQISSQIRRLQKTANAISTLDVLTTFAQIARRYELHTASRRQWR